MNDYMSMNLMKRYFKQESQIEYEKNINKIKCKCSCKIPLEQFNHKGWTVCQWCGRRVELPKTRFINEMKERLGL